MYPAHHTIPTSAIVQPFQLPLSAADLPTIANAPSARKGANSRNNRYAILKLFEMYGISMLIA